MQNQNTGSFFEVRVFSVGEKGEKISEILLTRNYGLLLPILLHGGIIGWVSASRFESAICAFDANKCVECG